MQGRSISLSSNCITSPYVFKRGRLEKHITVESDVEPSLEAHSDCFEGNNDIAMSKGIAGIVEETDNNSDDNDNVDDDVFKDQPVPQHLSKCVQTDIALIDAIIPLVARQDNYSQTQSSVLVSEETLDNNFIETSIPYSEMEETETTNQTGRFNVTSPSGSGHNEQTFQSNTCENVTFHQSSFEDVNTIKYLNLETLKLVRKNLKQQLEQIYRAQLNSNQSELLCSSDKKRVRDTSKLYGEKNTNVAHSMDESHHEILPFLSKRDAREKIYKSRKEVMSSSTFNKSSRPLRHSENVEAIECTHQFKTKCSKRQNKKLLSLDNSAKISSEHHLFTRQTTV
jgi:hypothetical protein